MKLRLIWLGIAALVVTLAACAPAPQLRDETLLADTSLIDATDEACALPCWRGITPGETAWRDAITVIEDSTDFENLQTREDENSDVIGAVWNARGGPECCQMVAEDGETVSLVFVRMRPQITLDEVLDAHGEPTYAIGTPVADDQALVNLVYPEQKVILLVFVAGEGADISASSDVIGALYTTEKDMDLFTKTQFLHEWHGYDSFAEYRQAEDAEYEVTPSVTLTPTPAQ